MKIVYLFICISVCNFKNKSINFKYSTKNVLRVLGEMSAIYIYFGLKTKMHNKGNYLLMNMCNI